MKTKDIISHFGDGNRDIAQAALGISRQRMDNWIELGEVPQQSQPMVEILSEGKFKWKRPAGLVKAAKEAAEKAEAARRRLAGEK